MINDRFRIFCNNSNCIILFKMIILHLPVKENYQVSGFQIILTFILSNERKFIISIKND